MAVRAGCAVQMRSGSPPVCEQCLQMAAKELLLVVVVLAEAAQGHLGTMMGPNKGSYVDGIVNGAGNGDEYGDSQHTEPRSLDPDITRGLRVIRALDALTTSDQRMRTAQNQRRRWRRYGGRMVDGRPTSASEEELPFHALVLADSQVLCSGALIKEDAVLTAAHCVSQHQKWVVQLGSEKCLVQEEGTQMIDGARVETHPDYRQNHTQHDIAVVFLKTPAVLNTRVQTVRLPTDTIHENLEGKLGIVAGWGWTEESEECSQVLRYAPLVVDSDENCETYFPDYNATTSFCAGGKWGASVCNGDNGSPFSVGGDDGSFVVVGVASFVFSEFCLGDFPSGFTRVTAYLQWITQTAGISLT